MWSAPEGCPSAERIVEATRARLGEPVTDAPPELFVHGSIVARKNTFVVTLVVLDPKGARVGDRVVRVESASCEEVLTPSSVVLAMMIAVVRPRVDSGEPASGVEGAPVAIETPPVDRSDADTRRLSSRFHPMPGSDTGGSPVGRATFGTSGVASVGPLPQAGLGLGIHAFYEPAAHLLLGLDARFEAGGTVSAGGGDVGFRLASAAARVGLSAVRTARLELVPMVEARAGVIVTSPVGYAAVQNETRLTTAVGMGALARVRLVSSLFLEGLFDAERLLLRDRFQIREGDKLLRIHEPSPFAGRFSLGIAYDLE